MPEFREGMSTLIKTINRYISLQSKIKNYELAGNVNKSGSNKSIAKMSLETQLLETTEIVFVTLGSSGSTALTNSNKFEVVIIDEAAQVSERAFWKTRIRATTKLTHSITSHHLRSARRASNQARWWHFGWGVITACS